MCVCARVRVCVCVRECECECECVSVLVCECACVHIHVRTCVCRMYVICSCPIFCSAHEQMLKHMYKRTRQVCMPVNVCSFVLHVHHSLQYMYVCTVLSFNLHTYILCI